MSDSNECRHTHNKNTRIHKIIPFESWINWHWLLIKHEAKQWIICHTFINHLILWFVWEVSAQLNEIFTNAIFFIQPKKGQLKYFERNECIFFPSIYPVFFSLIQWVFQLLHSTHSNDIIKFCGIQLPYLICFFFCLFSTFIRT